MPDQRVLGVDTSLRSTGVGVVEARGSSYRCISWDRIKNPATRSHSESLAHLHREMEAIIQRDQPSVIAIEGIFFSKNVRTAVTLGQARGVVLALCALNKLDVYEYSPRSVKQAVVGNGNAHKEQVARMIKVLLSLTEEPPDDAADALALAISHLHQSRLGLTKAKKL